jgi:membrane fusion protein, adhesin transport system
MKQPMRSIELVAATLVPAPVRTKTAIRLLVLGLVALCVALALAPWQQSVSGQGRVIAYAPVERRQSVDAPVAGRIVRWFVQEGATVVAGQELVEISDNDPLFAERLQTERAAVASKLASYEEQVDALEAQIANAARIRRMDTVSAEAKLRVATEKLRSLEMKVEAADAALVTATLNLGRTRALADRGLAAERDLEFAALNATKARTDREGAQADVHAALGEIDAARAAIEKVRADGDAKIQDAEVKLRSGRSEVADARASLTRLEVTIARQANQVVRASRAAVILQVLAAQGGEQVKQGDPLAMLVPVTDDRAVEVWIDGNDAAIVSERRHVRLQFEGWPAVQFVGWPSVAVGTFGGVVAFIDPHDDGKGNFRVVMVPDSKGEPWPSARFLRQGVRTKAWILLERVSLGFELWRRFNGFPPMLEKEPASEPKQRADKKERT